MKSSLVFLLVALPFLTLAQFDLYDGIVVGNTVSGRSEGSTSGKRITSFGLGQQLMIQDETDGRDILGGNDTGACEDYGYKWYRVENSDGVSAWMYGKYLFKKDQWDDYRHAKVGAGLDYYGVSWTYGSASSLSYGPSDQDGLTGCDDLKIPFFYSEVDMDIKPIFVPDPTVLDGPNHLAAVFDSKLLMFMSGEGGDSIVKSIEQTSDGEIAMVLENGFQDGSNETTVYIESRGGKFVVTRTKSTSW